MTEKQNNKSASPDLFGQTGAQGINEQDFESLLSRLEEIVKQMESGGMTLSESLKLFEEGSALLKRLTAMLGEVREKVLMLVEGEGGKPELEEYTGEDAR